MNISDRRCSRHGECLISPHANKPVHAHEMAIIHDSLFVRQDRNQDRIGHRAFWSPCLSKTRGPNWQMHADQHMYLYRFRKYPLTSEACTYKSSGLQFGLSPEGKHNFLCTEFWMRSCRIDSEAQSLHIRITAKDCGSCLFISVCGDLWAVNTIDQRKRKRKVRRVYRCLCSRGNR